VVCYTLRFSDDYAIASLAKYHARAKSRWLRWPLRIVCAIGLLALAALTVAIKAYAVTIVPLTFLALLAAGPRIDYAIVKRRYRKHTQYGTEARVDLSRDGLRFTSPDFASEIKWSAFLSAVQFSDGILLYRAPWDYVWLPDASITDGGPNDVRAIARSAISKYETA